MSLIHAVDPATEAPGNKLRKVQAFIDAFCERCKSLYQPKQNIAVDKCMVNQVTGQEYGSI